MELALGTVQWGLAYGIAGRESAVPENEVRSILELATRRGIRLLDTAGAYGDIEQRLRRLMDGLSFQVVSKIPALPHVASDNDAAAWVVANARQSHERLGSSLLGLLLHRAEDLTGPRGLVVWRELSAWGRANGIALGASAYDPATALALTKHLDITLTQLPGNAFDQRIVSAIPTVPSGLSIHLRSAFLQGLLLMDLDAATVRLPAASRALQTWHAWCTQHRIEPLTAALSIVKGFTSVSAVVVGVESQRQLAEIADAWSAAQPLRVPELAQDAVDIIDPRLWRVSK